MKLNNIFKYLLIVLLFFFLTLYISQMTGYYSYNNYEQARMTKENIIKFEKDIKDGKEIDINNYVEHNKNYETKISSLSLKISNTIGKYIKKSLISVFRKINNLIE